jgi:hypothetical protein
MIQYCQLSLFDVMPDAEQVEQIQVTPAPAGRKRRMTMATTKAMKGD